jgi:cytochrome P450
MRLYPVVPLILRQATRDMRIRSRTGSYLVPQGTILAVHVMAMHHSERHWERPKEFLPVRCHDTSKRSLEPDLAGLVSHGLLRLQNRGGRTCACMDNTHWLLVPMHAHTGRASLQHVLHPGLSLEHA